jgi:phage gp46-like protein
VDWKEYMEPGFNSSAVGRNLWSLYRQHKLQSSISIYVEQYYRPLSGVRLLQSAWSSLTSKKGAGTNISFRTYEIDYCSLFLSIHTEVADSYLTGLLSKTEVADSYLTGLLSKTEVADSYLTGLLLKLVPSYCNVDA